MCAKRLKYSINKSSVPWCTRTISARFFTESPISCTVPYSCRNFVHHVTFSFNKTVHFCLFQHLISNLAQFNLTLPSPIRGIRHGSRSHWRRFALDIVPGSGVFAPFTPLLALEALSRQTLGAVSASSGTHVHHSHARRGIQGNQGASKGST